MSSQRRIQKELVDFNKSPITGIEITPEENNLYKWKVTLTAPNNSLYKGAVFKVNVEFSTDFPFKPPKVVFGTKIYHPNVDDDGSICVGILKNEMWKPSTKITEVFYALLDLLENPNPDDPLQTSIAEQYRNDPATFSKNVKEYIKKYC
ncbi:hypothetical protein HK099_000647 [Clydaea vesicula]|uniref:E2 ubiquitin-conjugating enzyme n=1 Tax=Clydaea vesicula TaxID=447962 RepID=A0AAD5U488_9FUNG|nr:hypothetical protein HK099_000647 [Clydaea vesicula]KAJ3395782.1 hypothetical protein HDU92_004945 [Lobulomyces angularis]